VLAFFGWWIAFSIGIVVGVGRTASNKIVSIASRLYIDVFRNIPLLVQMFLWFFVLPELLPSAVGSWIKQMPPPWGSVHSRSHLSCPLHGGPNSRAGAGRHQSAGAKAKRPQHSDLHRVRPIALSSFRRQCG
jgi:hypothetical protein